jgi:hypothetical protein
MSTICYVGATLGQALSILWGLKIRKWWMLKHFVIGLQRFERLQNFVIGTTKFVNETANFVNETTNFCYWTTNIGLQNRKLEQRHDYKLWLMRLQTLLLGLQILWWGLHHFRGTMRPQKFVIRTTPLQGRHSRAEVERLQNFVIGTTNFVNETTNFLLLDYKFCCKDCRGWETTKFCYWDYKLC